MIIHVSPVAYVRSTRVDARDDDWGKVESRIELCSEFEEEAFSGLEEFSHVEVVYLFDQVPQDAVVRGARQPRENSAWPRVGIFAQRGKDRPNRLGVSTATLLARNGRELLVRGLDAIDGTPVLDVKPVFLEFLPRGEVCQPAWSHELMKRYWD